MRALAREWADSALLCAPQLAIVRNGSPYTIVAYAVSFKSTRRDGKWDKHLSQFKYPDAVVATDPDTALVLRDREIRPSEQRLVAMNFEVDPNLDNSWIPQMARAQHAELAEFAGQKGFSELEIAIDAILFEDGRLLGDNQSQLDNYFLAYFNRKQELYRATVALMADRRSLGEALATLKSIPPWAVEEGKEPESEARLAIGEATWMRTRFGEKRAADAVRRAVRTAPFAIRAIGTQR